MFLEVNKDHFLKLRYLSILVFVMGCVFFEVRNELLDIVKSSLGYKRINYAVLL
jgi:hypothetical protein